MKTNNPKNKLMPLVRLASLAALLSAAPLMAQFSASCPISPNARVGVPFTKQVIASLGTTPYGFGLVSGAPAGMTINPTTGVISWTAPAPGIFNYSVEVFDSGPDPDFVGATALNCFIDARNLPAPVCPVEIRARVGVPYSQPAVPTGGFPPYTLTVVGGPAGLTATGTNITGNLTTVGNFPYTIQVTDNEGGAVSIDCNIQIRAPLAILCPTSTATVGVAYSGQLTATGGYPLVIVGGTGSILVYTFTLVTGPTGLTVSTTGQVNFSPPTAQLFTYTVQVADIGPAPNTAQQTCEIDARLPLTIACPTLLTARAGSVYTGQLTATGGISTGYVFSLVSTAVPGLTVSATGVVTATPAIAGVFVFRASVLNGNFSTAIDCELDVRATLVILCPVPSATSGTLFTGILQATGGVPSYTFSLISGPSGLTVSPTGQVSFTPPAPGITDYVVQVADQGPPPNTAQQTCTVDPRAPLALLCPTNTVARPGVPYSGNLSAAGGFPPYTFTLAQPVSGLSVSSAGVVSFVSQATATISYTATVADQSATLNAPVSQTCTINVIAPLQLLCPVDRPALLGGFYSVDLSATGGIAPYTYALVSTDAAGALVNGRNFSFRTSRAGTFTYVVSATDAGGGGISAQTVSSPTCTATVETRPISLFCGNPQPGIIGQPFSHQFLAQGGVPPFRWTFAGRIPGMAFDGDNGVLSGTPTATGNFGFTISVEDTVGTTASSTCGIQVRSLPIDTAASCGTLGLGRVGTPYQGALRVSGGVAPYFWSLASGNLPGLVINPNGTVTGEPTTAGQFAFTATVRDSGGEFQQTQTVSCRIAVNENFSPLNASCGTLPQGRQGEPFAGRLIATGGREPYLWSLAPTSDQIPGVTFGADGSLNGTTTTAGAFRLVARVRDSGTGDIAQEKEITCGVSVAPRPGGMTLACGTLASVRVGQPFPAFPLAVTGGEAPYTFNLIRGAMPAGIQIANAAISGTPTDRGLYAFTIEARDSNTQLQQTARASCAMEVLPELLRAACGTLPNGRPGRQYTARLNAQGGVAPFNWTLEPGSALPSGLTLASDGQIWGIPASTLAAPANFNVRVVDGAGSALQQSVGPLACSIAVPAGDLPAPSVSSSVTTTPFPTQLGRFSIALAQPVPETLRGRATLRFNSSASNAPTGYFDPALRFGAIQPCGGAAIDAICRTLDFTVPPNTTQVVLPGEGGIVQGTVAGNILVNVTFPAASNPNVVPPADQQQTLPVRALAPVIDSVDLFPIPGGFEVEIAGYSTPRALTRADVTLNLDGSTESFQVSLESAANAWFGSDLGRLAGGQFRVRIPFEFPGVASQEIRSVQVTVVNSAGSTAANPAVFR